ncbi:putative protein kinase [Besnoitia besnoiti]|uniref:non-specific serine/threonine protein kinase n=1 Tax=Besnoitia besnoiti TaxID=94643 RepID=A0A2A9M4I8_BESBE|nr:putative protein kinase [Besnoitia besnoiti]PFH31221.1 putative protein kinase [Besnoitia besnoiti]
MNAALERQATECGVRTVPVERKFIDEKGLRHINNYVVGRRLGSGHFSSLKQYDLVDPGTGAVAGQFACKRYRKAVLARKKQFRKDPETGRPQIYSKLQEVLEEIKVLAMLNHPHCLHLREVLSTSRYDDSEDGKLYIITNLQACGAVMSLEDAQNEDDEETFVPALPHKSTIPEAVCRCIIRDAAKGLLYMHEELNAAHRDVKPDNLLMGEDGTVQLGDMGTAEFMDARGRVRHTKGTYMFMAPESMRVSGADDEAPYTGHSGRAADVWALGISLYVMLFGRTPFKATACMETLFEQLERGHVEIPPGEESAVSEQGKEVLGALLQAEVKDRITLPQLLEHPWIKEADSREAAAYAKRVLDAQSAAASAPA